MPAIRLPSFDQSLFSMPIEEQVRTLADNQMRYKRELEYLLNGALDEDNGVFKSTLFVNRGYITELTVDSIDTSDMVKRYLMPASNALRYAPVGYWRGYDHYIEFLSAKVVWPEDTEKTPYDNAVQVTDRNGVPIYWSDATHTGITYTVNANPVMRFLYNGPNGDGVVLFSIFLEPVSEGLYVTDYKVRFTFGEGRLVGGTLLRGQSFIDDEGDGISISHQTVGNAWTKLFVTADGVRKSGGAVDGANIRNIAVASTPTEAATAASALGNGDLLVVTQSQQDLDGTTGSDTIARLGSQYVNYTGLTSGSLNMPADAQAGDMFYVKNKGSGTCTLNGTFDGDTNLMLAVKGIARVRYNGTDWDVL